MIIRLSVKIPKAMTTLLNGLEVHVPAIAEHALEAAPGDPWTGWVVARVESVEAGGRVLATGEPTADVAITAVELMQEEDAARVRELFEQVRTERLRGGSLLDDEVVGDDAEAQLADGIDPPRQPGETDAEYAAAVDAMREGERVGLERSTDPADFRQRVGAKAAAERLAADWSPADDVNAS